MSSVALSAETGRPTGSAASRRLRAEGKVPAVVYGHGTETVSIAVDHRELLKAFRTEAGRNVIFSLEIDGKAQTALAQDVQRHPYKSEIRHVDFVLVDLDEVVIAEVPMSFTGESVGAIEGGVMTVIRPVVQVQSVLSNLPSEIVIDVSDLGQGDALRIEDLPEMDGVTYLENPSSTVVTITAASQVEAPVEEGEDLEEGEEGEAGEEDEVGEEASGEETAE